MTSSGDSPGDADHVQSRKAATLHKQPYMIYVIGSEGVGKRALIRDFVMGRDVDNTKSFGELLK